MNGTRILEPQLESQVFLLEQYLQHGRKIINKNRLWRHHNGMDWSDIAPAENSSVVEGVDVIETDSFWDYNLPESGDLGSEDDWAGYVPAEMLTKNTPRTMKRRQRRYRRTDGGEENREEEEREELGGDDLKRKHFYDKTTVPFRSRVQLGDHSVPRIKKFKRGENPKPWWYRSRDEKPTVSGRVPGDAILNEILASYEGRCVPLFQQAFLLSHEDAKEILSMLFDSAFDNSKYRPSPGEMLALLYYCDTKEDILVGVRGYLPEGLPPFNQLISEKYHVQGLEGAIESLLSHRKKWMDHIGRPDSNRKKRKPYFEPVDHSQSELELVSSLIRSKKTRDEVVSHLTTYGAPYVVDKHGTVYTTMALSENGRPYYFKIIFRKSGITKRVLVSEEPYAVPTAQTSETAKINLEVYLKGSKGNGGDGRVKRPSRDRTNGGSRITEYVPLSPPFALVHGLYCSVAYVARDPRVPVFRG